MGAEKKVCEAVVEDQQRSENNAELMNEISCTKNFPGRERTSQDPWKRRLIQALAAVVPCMASMLCCTFQVQLNLCMRVDKANSRFLAI
jgi:hypothetical protein